GSFGSVSQSKRELAAEVASVLAFSAVGNRDKVGLLLFTDGIELFLPPQKGRSQVLRIIREVLYFQPQGRKTDLAAALEYLNKVVTRRAVVFLVSDFQAPDFSRALSAASQRHDLVAVPVVDPLEEELPDIGRVSLEDAETGAIYEVNTSDRRVRTAFANAVSTRRQQLAALLRQNRVDAITLRTDADYLPALRAFFQQRERRIARR
ncbi:MAG: VWA domain-containing protein, partial [Gluconacetobacter diazotrophicus]|nr:VWA domain-containing protein [Gluconacetobacter diazotrophicus]